MNRPKKLPNHLDLHSPSSHQNESVATWRSAKRILRLGLPVVTAGVVPCVSIASPVPPKSGHQADAKETSAIDPKMPWTY